MGFKASRTKRQFHSSSSLARCLFGQIFSLNSKSVTFLTFSSIQNDFSFNNFRSFFYSFNDSTAINISSQEQILRGLLVKLRENTCKHHTLEVIPSHMVSRYNNFIILRDATSTNPRGVKTEKMFCWMEGFGGDEIIVSSAGSMSLLYRRDGFKVIIKNISYVIWMQKFSLRSLFLMLS